MIIVIDYGAGNTASVANALKEIGTHFYIVKDYSEINEFDKIILPGVGEAKYAMQQLKERNFINLLKSTSKPVLGICLGMQLLTVESEEGDTICLNILPCRTKKFSNLSYKVPHMGWNNVQTICECKLFKGIEQNSYFYFAHSFYVEKENFTVATANHGIEFSSVIQKENYYGVQFHPEKSGTAGLQLLKNFGEL